jgi:hypothetical protein
MRRGTLLLYATAVQQAVLGAIAPALQSKKKTSTEAEFGRGFCLTLVRRVAHDAGAGQVYTDLTYPKRSGGGSFLGEKFKPSWRYPGCFTAARPASRKRSGSRSPCFAASTIFLAIASRTAVGCGVRPSRAQALAKADPSIRVASGSNEPEMGENRSMDGTNTLHNLCEGAAYPNPRRASCFAQTTQAHGRIEGHQQPRPQTRLRRPRVR